MNIESVRIRWTTSVFLCRLEYISTSLLDMFAYVLLATMYNTKPYDEFLYLLEHLIQSYALITDTTR